MSEMPREIFAWVNQPSINVENYSSGKSWSSNDECAGTEFSSKKYHRDDIHQAVVDERDALRENLRECLRCILMRDNGITDVIWQSNFVTLAEYIADALDEDIDFEDVAASVQDRKIEYKCPKTSDFEVEQLREEKADMLAEMEKLAQALEDTGHEPEQSFYDAIRKARGEKK
jgi:methylphosphotriester-DNA--protein-cysteine methyltransferase